MNDTCPCNDADLISSVEGYQALPDLLQLLAEGRPIDLDEFLDVTGPAALHFAKTMRAQPATEWDDEGRLVGFGLTPRPTDYRFIVGGKCLYTWCASDTLFFTVLLGQKAQVESTCPTTGVPIRVEITPEEVTSVAPLEAVVSQRHRNDLVGNLRADICDHGHFFASAAAAAQWLAEHPDGRVLRIPDAFAECRRACAALGWLPLEIPAL